MPLASTIEQEPGTGVVIQTGSATGVVSVIVPGVKAYRFRNLGGALDFCRREKFHVTNADRLNLPAGVVAP